MPSLLNELLDPKQVVLELRATNESQAILEIVELLRGGELRLGLELERGRARGLGAV